MPDQPQPDDDNSQLPPIAKATLDDYQQPANPSNNAHRQFRISTLLSWTAVIAILLSFLGFESFGADWGETRSWEQLLLNLFFIFCFFAAPLTCLPVLIDHLFAKKGGLEFSLFWRSWLTICLAIYSMLMLMLATIAFEADWKGTKGMHWFYYTLDNWAGTTLWPIYFLGASLFIVALFRPEKPRRSVLYLVATLTCAFISGWYVLASMIWNFTGGMVDEPSLAFVPAATGVGYLLYAGIILRNCKFGWDNIRADAKLLVAWFTGLLISICVKYPLAFTQYMRLADEAPDHCFIVTAAARGHRSVVGAWHDRQSNRWLNQQLLTFWSFERWLTLHLPKVHRSLRFIYNRIGPQVARLIVFRWQADFVYWSLKPLEWLIQGFKVDVETDSTSD